MTHPPQPTSKNPESNHPQLTQHAQNVWEYQPQAVVAPNGSPPRIHSGEQLRQLFAAQPDAHTLFYDLVRTLDGKHVLAFQAGEFAELFGALTFMHRGKRLRAQQRRIGIAKILETSGKLAPMPTLWRIRLPREARHATAQIKIRTASGTETEINVPPNPFAGWSRNNLFKQAMIKDYPFMLARDNLLFHHRVHGFNRIVIYDNGSASYTEQLGALGTLDPDLQIVVINWPFPWSRQSVMKQGLKIDILSKFVAFNHGLHSIGGLSLFGCNLDMDEYIYNPSGMPLTELMARQTRFLPYRRIAMYEIPCVTDMNHGKYATALDFLYMPRNLYSWSQLYHGTKCFYRTGKAPSGMRAEDVDIHHVHLKGTPLARIRNLAVNLFGKRRIFGIAKISHELIRIYHYTGMGPNWYKDKRPNSPAARWELQPPDPHKHVRFKEIAQLMASIGLDNPQGENP